MVAGSTVLDVMVLFRAQWKIITRWTECELCHGTGIVTQEVFDEIEKERGG